MRRSFGGRAGKQGEQMEVINRAVAIIKPKQPYLDWANSLPEADEDFTMAEVCTDCTAILIPDYGEDAEAEAFVQKIYPTVFEMELEAWERDELLWPPQRDYQTFRNWFEVEIHSTVIDATGEEITKEVY